MHASFVAFTLLIIPHCLATWDDQGYNLLCGQKYQCSCPNDRFQSYIDCTLRNISALPSNIYFPEKLETIIFRNNHISDILDYTFYNGYSITEVDLSYNRIKFIASSSFLPFEKLIHLYLSHNELSSLPVRAFDGLKNLKTLDLSFNKLQAFLSNMFEPTSRLVELKLKFNPLLDIDDTSFEHLPVLEKLELENTGLSTLPENIFSYVPHLKFLSLASNGFTEVPSRALKKCGELKILDISENSIKVLKANAFYGLGNLTGLFMNGQRGLTAIRECAFGDLNSLQVLQCSYNSDLTHLDSLAFYRVLGSDEYGIRMAGPIRLEQLHMKDNAFEHIGSVLHWKDLSYLDLRGNPFKCDCNMQWLAEDFPRNFKENVRCASPPSLKNVAVSKLKPEDFVCAWYIFTDSIVYFIAVVMLAVFALCWILLLSIYFLCKLQMKVKANHQRRYTLIVPKVDKIDLEWDPSADP